MLLTSRRASRHPSPSYTTLRRPFTDDATATASRTCPLHQNDTELPQSFTHDTLQNKKVLIANRGEIAMRIARAARSLGAKSLSICVPEDVAFPHVEFADEHVVLPSGETAIAPSLDVESLTEVAVENGVDFVHPGVIIGCGFLSESAPFAQSLASSGIEWVGPPPEVLQLFGDKFKLVLWHNRAMHPQ